MRLRALLKWKRLKILMPGTLPFFGTTASPLVRFQSMEVSVAFSRGSPTMPSSSCAREWHDASTWMLSGGASETGQISGRPLRPAMPSTTRLSLVRVPVLSKQQISTLPANGIRNGSVQNTSSRVSASSDVFTARDSSIGSSGGTTDVRISAHSRNSL
uniref:Putative secreted protein n=1 Tax=Ixodes ricinus TaxID=34613 RepID=A0A6B0UWV4_IXORI